MEIPLDRLLALVNDAFDRGMTGCSDLKKQDIDDLCAKYNIKDTDDYRVWRAAELREMPDGSIFQHLLNGRCWVVSRANGTKFMQFDRGQAVDFSCDGHPWDKPMRLIHSQR